MSVAAHNDNVLELLEALKEKGFSPAERAIAFSEWQKYAVHFIGDQSHPNFTPWHAIRQTISEKVKERLWALENPTDLRSTDGSPYLRDVRDICQTALGVDSETLVACVRENLHVFKEERFGEPWSHNDTIAALSCSVPSKWETLREMEMDEEDLALFLERKSPQPSIQFPAPSNLTLQDARLQVQQALERAQIPVCCVDCLTQNSPAALHALAKSIERMCEAYEALGVTGPGLNGVDLNVVAPYSEGHSGFMSSCTATSALMPNHKPYVSMSNRCGWEFEEVLVHEYLHAHDALFNAASNPAYLDKKELISDAIKGPSSPLLNAWVDLAHTLENLTTTHTTTQKKQLARQGIGQRWKSMGVDPVQLDALVQAWEKSTDAKKDLVLHQGVEQLFATTQFAPSGAFRTNVVVAECKLLEQLDSKPVHQQFVNKFDDMHISQEIGHTYGRGYFEDLAEKMARSIQAGLDTLPSSVSVDNPYAKRWLVYADQSLSPAITQAWKDFFAKPCVQEAYEAIRVAPPSLSSLKDRVLAKRATKTVASAPTLAYK